MQGAVFWVPLIMPENTDNRKNKASTGINCPGSYFCALFGPLRPGEGVFFSPTSAKRTHTYTKTSYCILRSPADSDAFQSGRYAEHNGHPETPDFIV